MIRTLVVTLLLGGALGCNSSSRAATPAPGEATQPEQAKGALASDEPTSPEERRAILSIEGVVCRGWAEVASQTLERVAGVVSAAADFQSGTATVLFDPSRTNVDALAAAIEGVDRGPAPAFRVTARRIE